MQHLQAAGHLYPDCWKIFDGFRKDRDADLPLWPDWCFCPMGAAYSIVSGGSNIPLSLELSGDVGRLAAMAAWRASQGVYRFDPGLYDAICTTPVTGDLPCEVLFRMPEWCVYIETPGMSWVETPLYGFFAHLEWDANNGREELRLLLDSESSLQPIALHIGAWPLQEALLNAMKVGALNARERGIAIPANTLGSASEGAALFEPLLSLLLYLCAENAEIGDGSMRPERPKPKKTKSGLRLFPPDKPTTWDVGVRLGAALRMSGASKEEDGGESRPHGSPRPHIRRAHWHAFRVGAGKLETVLRWLPPIPVNMGDQDQLPATVHPV